MRGIYCPSALLPTGWAENVRIEFDETGTIATIRPNAERGALPPAAGPVLPGMPNLHSHAFQRAMAGLTERVGPSGDTFWTWRKVMYEVADRMTLETVEATAAQLYVDMLKNGYTAVGEFHYLHHANDGHPYAQRALLSHRVISAARQVGIGITHLPVLYAHSTFGATPPTHGQRRFVNDLKGFAEILEDLTDAYRHHQQVRIGIAPHSLRAVSPELLRDVLALLDDLDATAPIHIHIAEQEKEVADCVAWCGRRPVEWLLDHAAVSERWCLVHATHMTPDETTALAETGVVAGLCPTTEANLGDGLFPTAAFLKAGGRFGLGSDSHISVSPSEELRLLEYEQRLTRHQRNVLHTGDSPSVGMGLYAAALEGGARAVGRAVGRLAPGYRADLVVLDADQPLLYGKTDDRVVDTYVFAGGGELVRDVIVGGNHVIQEGRHPSEEAIAARYRAAVASLA
ncbi:MAG: formimidoylglutamate deiminase [Rhodothermales bacterium]